MPVQAKISSKVDIVPTPTKTCCHLQSNGYYRVAEEQDGEVDNDALGRNPFDPAMT